MISKHDNYRVKTWKVKKFFNNLPRGGLPNFDCDFGPILQQDYFFEAGTNVLLYVQMPWH